MFPNEIFNPLLIPNNSQSNAQFNSFKQESKQLDQSTYSIASQESTQSSDNNSQGSDDNFKQFNSQKSFKKEIYEDYQNQLEAINFKNKPQMILDYAPEIFNYLRSTEDIFLPNPSYMLNQTDINENMRALLIDWLVDVHFKFKLSPETLFMTVNLIDRYLSKIIISRKIFQLIGVSALFIACKYEEVYVPEVNEFSRITEKTYSVKEILDMEGHILSVLQFDLTFTSSHRFLERYSYLSNFDGKSFRLARFLLEIALIEYKMVKYPPSMLAASAIYLTKKINKLPEPWSKLMAYHSNYLQKDLFECSTDLLQIWRNSERTSLNAVTRKYSFQNSKDNSRFGTQ